MLTICHSDDTKLRPRAARLFLHMTLLPESLWKEVFHGMYTNLTFTTSALTFIIVKYYRPRRVPTRCISEQATHELQSLYDTAKTSGHPNCNPIFRLAKLCGYFLAVQSSLIVSLSEGDELEDSRVTRIRGRWHKDNVKDLISVVANFQRFLGPFLKNLQDGAFDFVHGPAGPSAAELDVRRKIVKDFLRMDLSVYDL
ncbi:hypothetical protein BXZ70DRAFT_933226 [Cristinia sonorae]|uniref:Uncharacterized protein n=1 Tax=Cristinia sonorae TaxID=1940300 RepID=A0A8K0XR57_9AGAR|nr:hypothetical protein BXZ70DRAFT_933226 [Cristinia sonorae]